MDEQSSLEKGGDENIIKFASRAKMIRDELAMLGNPADDNTRALRVLSGLPAEYGMLRAVLENKKCKLVMSDVTAKLLQVEQLSITDGASKPSGSVKSKALAAAAPKKPSYKKSVVCFYCSKKGHMQRDYNKQKADEAKGKCKPGGGGREGGQGGGPHAGAALAYTASTGNDGSSTGHGSTRELSTWVLDSDAISHMVARDTGFSVRTAGSGAEVTLANGDKVPIKRHGHVSMDVGKGNTKTRMVLEEPMLVPNLTSNLLLPWSAWVPSSPVAMGKARRRGRNYLYGCSGAAARAGDAASGGGRRRGRPRRARHCRTPPPPRLPPPPPRGHRRRAVPAATARLPSPPPFRCQR